MGEEGVAQVAHHELTNRSGKPRLGEPDAAVDDRHHHHQAGVEREEAEVALWDGLVDEELQEVGVGEPQDARPKNGEPDDGETPAIWPEELRRSS